MADVISGDRRTSKRYQHELAARFHYLAEDGVTHIGYGITVELSRRSVLLLAEEAPPAGVAIEIRIDWPFLLQDVCPLELIIKGRVFRISQRGIIVENDSYEFRTCGARSFSAIYEAPKTSMTA